MIGVINTLLFACQIYGTNALTVKSEQRECQQKLVRCAENKRVKLSSRSDISPKMKEYIILSECIIKNEGKK